MIGIQAVSEWICTTRLDNRNRIEGLDASESLLNDKIGVMQIARLESGEETSDLCVHAINKLLSETNLAKDDIQCLVVVTQNPDGTGLPHTSAITHGKLGLPRSCATFDVALGCSGYVYGLTIIKSFMEGCGFTKGILVTADPYSKVVSMDDRDTSLLFGDGASATLLSDTPTWTIGSGDFGTVGELNDALKVQDNGKLYMNGRSVFSFSATTVPDSIKRTLDNNSSTLHNIDRFVLHQGSRFIVDTIAKRLEIEDRTSFCAQKYGNLVSSSIPVAFRDLVESNDKNVIISGFGVGLSWASNLLTRVS
jgi:3-oxoacyl-[acyl-carrier-protein] synthase III